MGMDLIGADLSYNWAGWRWLVANLEAWGVDVCELKFFNDGDPISAETCRAIADAIYSHLDELDAEDVEWIGPHIWRWRTCTGCNQW
jgi:hypothetical protein